MAKVSFSKPGGAAPVAEPAPAPAPAPEATTAVAVREPMPVSTVPYGDENIQMSDIVLPGFNIVQKVGDLSDNFTHGSIVLNLDLELPVPVRVLVLGFAATRFVEKVEGGGRGSIVDTKEEVVENGGTVDYNEHKAKEIPLYQPMATALILVEQPEGVDESSFPYEFGGKRYSIARWNLKGTGYTHGAKRFFTARKIGHLRGDIGYRGAFWTIATKLEKRGPNSYYIPVPKPAEATTPEFRQWIVDEVIGF